MSIILVPNSATLNGLKLRNSLTAA